MNPQLINFLLDVAQNVYGQSTLSYKEITEYSRKAKAEDINCLEDFFWSWSSHLTSEDEIDISELEEHIREVIAG